MHQEAGKKAIVAALAANLAIAVSKLVGFAITGAASMLAESIHSLADSGNQGLLLLGRKLSNRPPDDEHPFGYGRERFFWAFVVSIVLFSLGSLAALYEGVNKLRHPHELESPIVAVVILVVAIVLESFSFRTAIHEARPLKGDLTWRQFIRQTKVPELAVVLLEDFGALLGLLFALVGVGLATVTHNARFDAMGSIAIGLLLGAIAYILARENKSLLIGESASPSEIALVRSAIASAPAVNHLIHLRTLQLSPSELLIAAKLEFDSSLDQAGLAAAIDATEVLIRAAVPTAHLVFLEPDQLRPAGAG